MNVVMTQLVHFNYLGSQTLNYSQDDDFKYCFKKGAFLGRECKRMSPDVHVILLFTFQPTQTK